VELSHSFTVPADVETTWATFMDLREVGGCFPGATVTEASDEGFAGTVKVKLGPIALMYAGTGAFLERDDATHRAVIEAKGKDRRGNGTAGATVTIQLSDAGDGSTRADVQTDLAVTGKPAQFGRGVMQDVSDKLLGQFVGCIEGKLSPASEPVSEPASGPGPGPASEPAPAAAAGAVPEPTPVPAAQPAAEEVAPEPAARPAAAPTPRRDEAIDLGTTVLPVLLKTYGRKVALALVVVVAVVVVWRVLSR
jgi:carbon monoxide dehydrogenase subunit G